MTDEQALKKLHDMRTRLLLTERWYGSLAMRLDLEVDRSIPTLCTNGSKIKANPEYMATLPDAEIVTILAEETMHCALQHPYRIGSRDLKKANVAMDYAIYGILKAAGTFAIPADALYDAQYDGMSYEQIYAKREKDEQDGQEQGGNPGQDGANGPSGPVSAGGVEPAPATPASQPGAPGGTEPGNPGQGPTPETHTMTAEDWRIATSQATAVCQFGGNHAGAGHGAAKAARASREDWRGILREFVEQTTPSDYSWATPNRRYIHTGLYLPGVVKENLGVIALGMDTSGSISQRVIDCFAGQVTTINTEARPERIDVIYCDTRVQFEESFGPDDAEVKLTGRGGGGTRFKPVFDRIAEGEAPACLIYFTDLESSDLRRLEEPPYPVLWVTGEDVTKVAPFGRTIRVSLYD